MSKSAKDATNMTPEARYDYFVEQAKEHKTLWTLQDNDGCVMLTTDDEDCIPMWPSEETANLWAIDDWKECTPLSIPLDEWLERWVPGMQDDNLCMAIFPVQEDLGVVIEPYDVEQRLTPNKQQKH